MVDNLSIPKLTGGLVCLLSFMYLLLQTAPAQAITLTTNDYYGDGGYIYPANINRHSPSSYNVQQTLYHKPDGVPAAHKFLYTIDAAGGSVTYRKDNDNLNFFASANAEVASYKLEWNYGSSNVDLSREANLLFRLHSTHTTNISVQFYDDNDADGSPGHTYTRSNIAGSVNQLVKIPVSDLIDATDLDATKIRRIVATLAPSAGKTKGFGIHMRDVDSSTAGVQLLTTTPEPGLPVLAGAALLLMRAHRRQRAKNTHI